MASTVAPRALPPADPGPGGARLAPLPQVGLSTDVSMRDWDLLLCAVKSRISESSAGLAAAGADVAGNGSGGVSHHGLRDGLHGGSSIYPQRHATNLLECVGALDQLQLTLRHEFSRLYLLEIDLAGSRQALALARAELAATQAGEVRARHLALHDVLTSLPNRIFFRERLQHALGQAALHSGSLAVLYLDLDGFKPVNDAHGHHAGDELLGIVAARLTRAVRADDLVSRLGGDEFACLLADLPSREQLGMLACKLFDAVSAPLKIGNVRLRVRPSIGIAVYPDDGDTVDGLLDNADSAMYHAKRHRTGYAFFDQGVARCQ